MTMPLPCSHATDLLVSSVTAARRRHKARQAWSSTVIPRPGTTLRGRPVNGLAAPDAWLSHAMSKLHRFGRFYGDARCKFTPLGQDHLDTLHGAANLANGLRALAFARCGRRLPAVDPSPARQHLPGRRQYRPDDTGQAPPSCSPLPSPTPSSGNQCLPRRPALCGPRRGGGRH